MKSVYLIVGLLLCSVFATALIASDEDLNESLNDSANESESDTPEIPIEDIEEDLNDSLNDSDESEVSVFVNTWKGYGWITNDEEGLFIGAYWFTQDLVKDNETTTLSHGRLKIGTRTEYRLVKSDANDSDELVFYLVPLSKNVWNSEDAENYSIGTLTLENDKELGDFIQWTGSLEVDSGDLEGTWDVDLATKENTINTDFEKGEGRRLSVQEANQAAKEAKKNAIEAKKNAFQEAKEMKKQARFAFLEKVKFWKNN